MDEIEFDEPAPPPTQKKTFKNLINNAVLKNLQDVADVSDVIGEARDVFKSPPLNHKHTKEF